MHDCGCANRSGQDKGVYFTRVPSLVTNQGKEVENLSSERRSRWVSAISRDDLTDDFLENNTLFLERLPKAGMDLIMTGFQHCVYGTLRVLSICQN